MHSFSVTSANIWRCWYNAKNRKVIVIVNNVIHAFDRRTDSWTDVDLRICRPLANENTMLTIKYLSSFLNTAVASLVSQPWCRALAAVSLYVLLCWWMYGWCLWHWLERCSRKHRNLTETRSSALRRERERASNIALSYGAKGVSICWIADAWITSVTDRRTDGQTTAI